ncbi:MAG: hypothetical protein SFX73_35280 [Kofleriaceae bacterium]|nr:hypothetical protein [Kofleriaceae bacterium]
MTDLATIRHDFEARIERVRGYDQRRLFRIVATSQELLEHEAATAVLLEREDGWTLIEEGFSRELAKIDDDDDAWDRLNQLLTSLASRDPERTLFFLEQVDERLEGQARMLLEIGVGSCVRTSTDASARAVCRMLARGGDPSEMASRVVEALFRRDAFVGSQTPALAELVRALRDLPAVRLSEGWQIARVRYLFRLGKASAGDAAVLVERIRSLTPDVQHGHYDAACEVAEILGELTMCPDVVDGPALSLGRFLEITDLHVRGGVIAALCVLDPANAERAIAPLAALAGNGDGERLLRITARGALVGLRHDVAAVPAMLDEAERVGSLDQVYCAAALARVPAAMDEMLVPVLVAALERTPETALSVLDQLGTRARTAEGALAKWWLQDVSTDRVARALWSTSRNLAHVRATLDEHGFERARVFGDGLIELVRSDAAARAIVERALDADEETAARAADVLRRADVPAGYPAILEVARRHGATHPAAGLAEDILRAACYQHAP